MFGRKVFVLGNGTIVDNDYTKGTVIGNSEILGGNFKKLRIVGNTTITGNTNISILSVVGNIEAHEPVTAEIVKLTSHANFEKLDSKHIIFRWGDKNTEVFKLTGNINADLLEVLAKCHLEGCNKIKNYLISGCLETAIDINCENFICPGKINCTSINATNIYIYPRSSSTVKELYGTQIHIQRKFDKSSINISGKYSWKKHLRKATNEATNIEIENIEADDIFLEYTKAAHVSGKDVKIGPGCNIEHLEYIQSVTIDPDAIVGSLEKI